MKLVLRAIGAVAALLALWTLVALQLAGVNAQTPTQHHTDKRQDADNQTPNVDWQHGQRVPGRYLVVYRKTDSGDGSVHKRNHEDLITGLAARGVHATIVHGFGYGAEVHVRLDGGADEDGSHETHRLHERHLKTLPHVDRVQPVRIIKQSGRRDGRRTSEVPADDATEDAADDATDNGYTNAPTTEADTPDMSALDTDSLYGSAGLVGPGTLKARTERLPGRDRVVGPIDIAHQWTGASEAFDNGMNGTNTKIVVVSNGVDYEHRDLGGCFGRDEKCKVKFGGDLISDKYDERRQYAYDEPDPRGECNNIKGTSLVGVIVGESETMGWRGVAVGAELGVYRVFDCNGYSTTAVLLQALHKAVADEVDVILFDRSLDTIPGDRSILKMAVEEANAGGVVVFMPADEVKRGSLFSIGQLTTIEGVVTVTNAHLVPRMQTHLVFESKYKKSSGPSEAIGMELEMTSNWQIKDGWYRVVMAESSDDEETCATFPAQLPFTVLVVPDKACMHTERMTEKLVAKNVKRLLYEKEGTSGTIRRWGDDRIPFRAYVGVDVSTTWRGQSILVHLTSTNRQARAYVSYESLPDKAVVHHTAGLGPARNLGLLPTIAAPGTDILVLTPVKNGSYSVEYGTDLAAAYAAGSAALVRQHFPTLLPQGLFEALIGQAISVQDETLDSDAGVPVQGAGFIQVYAAFQALLRGRVPTLPAIFTQFPVLPLGDATADRDEAVEFEVCNNLRGSLPVQFNVSYSTRSTVNMYRTGLEASNRADDSASFTIATSPELVITPDGPLVANTDHSFMLTHAQCRKVKVRVPDRGRGLDDNKLPYFSGVVHITTPLHTHRLPYIGCAARLDGMEAIDWDETYPVSLDGTPLPDIVTYTPGTPFVKLNMPINFTPMALYVDIGTEDDRIKVPTVDSLDRQVVRTIWHGKKGEMSAHTLADADLTWDGTDSTGQPVPSGEYHFIVRVLPDFDYYGGELLTDDFHIIRVDDKSDAGTTSTTAAMV